MPPIVELLKVLLIGVVEGVTEWLPVSSTGHMILVDEFVKLDVSVAFWNMFLVVIQLGAILAVCVLYFSKLNPFSRTKTPEQRSNTMVMWAKIIVGVIPAGVLGLLLNDFMEEHLYTAEVVVAALIVYGIAFIAIERYRNNHRPQMSPCGAHSAAVSGSAHDNQDFGAITTMESLSFAQAFGIGCFQVLSLVPGTSRSGSTILGALLFGTTRTLAAEFSFYMAIPVMVGASMLKICKFFLKGNTFTQPEIIILLFGMAVAFVVSILSIKFLMKYIKTNDFKCFGYYRIVLGLILIGYFWLVGA